MSPHRHVPGAQPSPQGAGDLPLSWLNPAPLTPPPVFLGDRNRLPEHVPRFLVTVSRAWDDWPGMRAMLEFVHQWQPHATLVHGDNPRGDRHAAAMWTRLGGACHPMPADWDTCAPDCRPGHRRARSLHPTSTYCPTAGHRRNQAMVDSGVALLVPFTLGSPGTLDTVHRALTAGVPLLLSPCLPARLTRWLTRDHQERAMATDCPYCDWPGKGHAPNCPRR